ncbi:mucin [Metarhizium acridum CQMa 102]|uniref:Mucin n=2 Tax=Metarhizium acridum TaxID=92637 RepID=E9DVC0_METAQ|nr:mucin [Metarhizium acridum CQMa 102]EFY92297.1 mucin [Metarhizium acridum CQMa 102]
MTWADFKAPPGTQWNDPSKKGQKRNFNIALVTVDYSDMNFTITGPPNSTIFGTPSADAANIPRKDVPAWYRDFLNKPGQLNRGHTLHEYWMEDSHGRYGVDLASFGPYRMPHLSYQYGIDDYMNPGACPPGKECSLDIRGDALSLWRRDVGNSTAGKYELVFILTAGQDESSTWQEFGEMKFNSREDVPDAFGPPKTAGNATLPNYAATRYVPWTSWAAAASFWPNAGSGSSVQCESSGMATFAHELSHLLQIGDNYNNPYGTPLRRAFTGPWSMLSRGTFNGPGGPHTRWQVPPVRGASMGSLHTVRDKLQIGLIEETSIVRISRKSLQTTGPLVTTVTARSVKTDRVGVRVLLGTDMSPACDVSKDLYCDGGGYDNYDLEVVDRMGADSFQGDAGVMISKTRNMDTAPFQWTIDANPQDIKLKDFVRPNGTEAMITMGDYRQLLDALFHAGTRSGSKAEYRDEANGLHFYILEKIRDKSGVVSYTVGARALNSTSKSGFSVRLGKGRPEPSGNTPTGKGIFCSFDLVNDGKYNKGCGVTSALEPHVGFDIYRLQAKVKGKGWRTEVPNALVAAKFGEKVVANIAVGATANADDVGVVTLTVTSESDPKARTTATCEVRKA